MDIIALTDLHPAELRRLSGRTASSAGGMLPESGRLFGVRDVGGCLDFWSNPPARKRNFCVLFNNRAFFTPFGGNFSSFAKDFAVGIVDKGYAGKLR